MLNRRSFLHASTLLGFGATVPTFLGRTAHAAPALGKPGAADTILVVIQLTGGNDGLNTLIPTRDPEYLRLRPTLAIKKADALKLTDDAAFHPAMTGLARLYNDSAVCVVQGVGYPNPDQSHFRSMDIWQAGSTAETLTEGWLGRGLKQKPLPGFHLSNGNEAAPLALAGAPARVPSIGSLADFQLKTAAGTAAEQRSQAKTIAGNAEAMPMTPTGEPNLLDFVRRTATNTYASSARLQEVAKNYVPKATYPETNLGNRLKLAARLIEAGTGARIFYASVDGFDTHAGQGGVTGNHANLLGEVSAAITAFADDLKARGQFDRVCVMTFSEFGRRAHENGSKGTDHGSGAPMILVGGKVKPGITGDAPTLTKLDNGNLKHQTDFRQVYAAVLQDWLGLDAAKVLGDGFKPAAVFKG